MNLNHDIVDSQIPTQQLNRAPAVFQVSIPKQS